MKKSKADNDLSPQTLEEKTLRLNFSIGDVPSFNPQELASGIRGVALAKWLFEGLTRLNLDGNYELAGAEKVDISPCQTRYTFTLKKNCYSDGTPVVAYDYERSWKEALAPDSKCSKAHLFYYLKNGERAKKGEVSLDEVGVKALDQNTLLVEVNRPTPFFLGLLTSPVFSPFKAEGHKIFFNGPYTVTERKKDDYLVLEPNSHFWDNSHTAIKKVRIYMIQDSITGLSLYEKKELDWIGFPFDYLPSEIISSELAKGNLFRGEAITFPLWVYLNTDHFPLSSPFIRRALSCVIDRNEIAKHIFMGSDPLFAPLPHISHELCLNDDLDAGRDFFEKGLKELNLTKETFPPLKLSTQSLAGSKRLAEYMQEKWQNAFGIRVEIDIQDWNTLYANVAKGNYQAGGFAISSDYNDPVACLELLSSNANFSKWHHPGYRQVIEKLKCEEKAQLRTLLLEEAGEILKEEMPIIWMTNYVPYQAYPSNLKGLCFDQRGIPDLRWAYFE